MSSFCSAKATHIFSAKNIRLLYIESAKTVNEMTLNELVKLTMFWTTGPRSSYGILTRLSRPLQLLYYALQYLVNTDDSVSGQRRPLSAVWSGRFRFPHIAEDTISVFPVRTCIVHIGTILKLSFTAYDLLNGDLCCCRLVIVLGFDKLANYSNFQATVWWKYV